MIEPIKCGCGGEAKVETDHDTLVPGEPIEWKRVVCDSCNIRTTWRRTEAEAVTVWNRAMGAGKDKVAITKGYWMVTYDGLHCSVCNYKCETTAAPNVCPRCGARLEWE